MEEGRDVMKEGIHTVKEDSFADKANAGFKQIKEKVHVYEEGAREFIDAAGTYVKENPQRSALIAAGVGFGIGVLVTLLMRRRKD